MGCFSVRGTRLPRDSFLANMHACQNATGCTGLYTTVPYASDVPPRPVATRSKCLDKGSLKSDVVFLELQRPEVPSLGWYLV